MVGLDLLDELCDGSVVGLDRGVEFEALIPQRLLCFFSLICP